MAESRPLRVLIVDDEPLGIERLRELVEEQPNVEVVGTADDGRVNVDRERGYGHVTHDLAEGITFDIENALDLTGVTVRRRPPTDDAAVKASATGAAAPEATP